jgi:hypothetical protein
MKATIKNIKEHLQCDCGYNSVEDFKHNYTFKYLKQRRAKKNLCRHKEEIFYLIEAQIFCDACNDKLEMNN